jgi:crotonobetainyl-CoA:carnitine CoA-transferase CaiB-like acyl-CoA transferase
MQELVRPNDDAPAPRSPNGLGDHNTGMHLFTGITLALLHKAKTGEGQLVDASLLRSGVFGMTLPLMLAQTGEVGRKSARSFGSGLPNPTLKAYRTRDGEFVQLLGLDTLRHIPGVLEALSLKSFCDSDERFDSPKKCRKNRVALIPLMDRSFEEKDLADWEKILTAKDVWYTKAEKFENIWTDEQVNAVGTFDEVPAHASTSPDVDWTGTRLIGNPVKLSVGSNGVKGRAPKLGEHTIDVLKQVGIDPAGQAWAGLGPKN